MVNHQCIRLNRWVRLSDPVRMATKTRPETHIIDPIQHPIPPLFLKWTDSVLHTPKIFPCILLSRERLLFSLAIPSLSHAINSSQKWPDYHNLMAES